MALRRFYTPEEVATHNSATDCWVSIFHQVLDLSPLLTANRGPLANPLIDAAGQVRASGSALRATARRTPSVALLCLLYTSDAADE